MATWRWNKTHFRSRSLAEIAMLLSMLHIIWNLKLQHLRCNIKKSSQYPLSEIICSGLDDKSKNWQQTLPPNWLGGRIKTFFQAWDFLEILRKIYLDLLYPGRDILEFWHLILHLLLKIKPEKNQMESNIHSHFTSAE